MDKPGKLNNIFDNVDSTSSDPKLEWASTKSLVDKALNKKESKKRRRLLLLWWLGLGFLGAGLGFLLVVNPSNLDLQDKQIAAQQANDPYVTSDYNMKSNLTTKTEAKDITTDEQKIENIDKRQSTLSNQQIPVRNNRKRTSVSPTSDIKTTSPPMLTGTIVQAQSANESTLVESDLKPLTSRNDLMENESPPSTPLSTTEYLRIEKISTHFELIPIEPVDIQTILVPLGAKEDPKASRRLSIQLWAGINNSSIHNQFNYSRALQGADSELAMKYQIDKSKFVTFGVTYTQDRFQTEFEQQTDLRLYRPGTIDTIYRYSNTDDVLVLTDTISAVRTRSFGHTNQLTTIGLPMHFGYQIPTKGILIAPTIGVMPMMHQRFTGQTATADYATTSYDASKLMKFSIAYRAGLSLSIKAGTGRIAARYLWTRVPSMSTTTFSTAAHHRHSLQLGYHYIFY